MPSPTDWTPERWRHASDLLDALLDLPPEKRTAHLATVAETDSDLAADAARLLGRDASPLDRLRDTLADHVTDLIDAPLAAAPLPTAFGPYRVDEEIGRGGMGVVYRCERNDGAFDQTVAVKVLHVGVDRDVAERFRTEQRILARLDHPGIARLIDGGVTPGGQPFFVMDYVEGVPITDYARSRPLSERLGLFRQVCDAVHYAHQRLVIHRDLKPSNVLVTPDGHAKLLDFGIAKLTDADAAFTVPITQPNARWMTPTYASPEQIRGDEPTTATDVYALGVLLFELLTGRLPYDLPERARRAAEHAILETAPHKPSTMLVRGDSSERALTRSIRGDLDQVVLTALRKEPERRYESAAAFAADVGRWSNGEAVLAQPDTLGYRARTFARRRRRPLLAGFGLLLLLTLVGVSYVRGIAESRDAATLRAQESEAALGFLSGIFEANDPERNLGDVPTARDLLDAASARLDADSSLAPTVRGRIGLALGRAWGSLGELQRWEDAALDAHRRLIDAGADTLALLALHEAADAAQTIGRDDTAQVRLARIVAQSRRAGLSVSGQRRSALALAHSYRRVGQLDSAQAILSRLLDDTDPSETPFLYDLHVETAFVHRAARRSPDAESAFRRALALTRTLHGPDSPEAARALFNVGAFGMEAGNPRFVPLLDSVALLRADLLTRGNLPTRFDATLAQIRGKRAMDAGEELLADSLSSYGLTVAEAIFGPDHLDTSGYVLSRCTLLLELNRADDALPFCRRAVDLRHHFAPGTGPVVNAAQHLSYALLTVGNCADALALVDRTLAGGADMHDHVTALLLGSRARSLTCLRDGRARRAWAEYVGKARYSAAYDHVPFDDELAEAISDSAAAAQRGM